MRKRCLALALLCLFLLGGRAPDAAPTKRSSRPSRTSRKPVPKKSPRRAAPAKRPPPAKRAAPAKPAVRPTPSPAALEEAAKQHRDQFGRLLAQADPRRSMILRYERGSGMDVVRVTLANRTRHLTPEQQRQLLEHLLRLWRECRKSARPAKARVEAVDEQGLPFGLP